MFHKSWKHSLRSIFHSFNQVFPRFIIESEGPTRKRESANKRYFDPLILFLFYPYKTELLSSLWARGFSIKTHCLAYCYSLFHNVVQYRPFPSGYYRYRGDINWPRVHARELLLDFFYKFCLSRRDYEYQASGSRILHMYTSIDTSASPSVCQKQISAKNIENCRNYTIEIEFSSWNSLGFSVKQPRVDYLC